MARVLVLNCGSSSVKFALIETTTSESIASGLVENVGGQARFRAKGPQGKVEKAVPGKDHGEALEAVIKFFQNIGVHQEDIHAVGHRVVHGGEAFSSSVLIEEKVLAAIRACNDLAPLHNPANLVGIEVARRAFPGLPQVAVFDTAFHQTIPQHAFLYPIPQSLYRENGVRRYGFHGTSHRFVTTQAAEMLGKPASELCIITAHLGNGCSATAVRFGKSVDTTMGLTPMEGIPMGTRSGSIDPGIQEYLHNSKGWDFKRITQLLNKESGLLGLSELSNDMRTLAEAASKGHAGAALAIDVFCYRLAKEIASLTIALPRLDALVFTGGIGENNAGVRARTLAHLAIHGFVLDSARNAENGQNSVGVITQVDTPVAMVVPTNEELLIALDAEQIVSIKPMQ